MSGTTRLMAGALIGIVAAAGGATRAQAAETKCEMMFSLKGWSAFYKTAKGEGTIKCDNGQTAAVTIKVTGGGITFGKTEMKDATGKFSAVAKLDDLLGSYGAAQAEAGAVKSAEAQALTKGEVSLAISGTGEGFSLGVSGAKFTITKK
jgi:hypothetical protein